MLDTSTKIFTIGISNTDLLHKQKQKLDPNESTKTWMELGFSINLQLKALVL